MPKTNNIIESKIKKENFLFKDEKSKNYYNSKKKSRPIIVQLYNQAKNASKANKVAFPIIQAIFSREPALQVIL